MFHRFLDSKEFIVILAHMLGTLFIILPTFIASLRKRKNIALIAVLNGLVYALLDISAFVAKNAEDENASMTLFICAWVLWAVVLVFALFSKRKK